ncbi:unnamed protein product, partial [Prorocentrum cordatum]
ALETSFVRTRWAELLRGVNHELFDTFRQLLPRAAIASANTAQRDMHCLQLFGGQSGAHQVTNSVFASGLQGFVCDDLGKPPGAASSDAIKWALRAQQRGSAWVVMTAAAPPAPAIGLAILCWLRGAEVCVTARSGQTAPVWDAMARTITPISFTTCMGAFGAGEPLSTN